MDCCADFEEENEEGEKANVEQHMQLVDQHLSKAKMHYKGLKERSVKNFSLILKKIIFSVEDEAEVGN